MEILIAILTFVTGACMGSFLCCQARRLRLKEEKSKKLGPRSVCLSCKTRLKWYDNIPIISWIILKGKCRKCGEKIGLAEILSEIGVGLAFCLLGLSTFLNVGVFKFSSSPLSYIYFAVLLVLFLSLAFLAIYDGLYGELPVPFLTISIICAIIMLILRQWILFFNFQFSWQELLASLVPSVVILGGLYFVLYIISKEKWVGGGDWILGVAIGIALDEPTLVLLVLFLSNLLACLTMLPFSKGKNIRIPFGPFLVIAFIIVYTFPIRL